MIPVLLALTLLAGVGSLWAVASYEDAHAEALQAQALITANQTAQVSVVGQTVLSLVLAAILIAILVGVVLGLVMFKRWQTAQAQKGQWASGPNAYWQKNGPQLTGMETPAFGVPPQQALLIQQQMMQQQLMLVWLMRQMGGSPETSTPPSMQIMESQAPELPWWNEN